MGKTQDRKNSSRQCMQQSFSECRYRKRSRPDFSKQRTTKPAEQQTQPRRSTTNSEGCDALRVKEISWLSAICKVEHESHLLSLQHPGHQQGTPARFRRCPTRPKGCDPVPLPKKMGTGCQPLYADSPGMHKPKPRMAGDRPGIWALHVTVAACETLWLSRPLPPPVYLDLSRRYTNGPCNRVGHLSASIAAIATTDYGWL